ncbi:hypothetical protein ACTA71_000766 [Dictyostelium dimigraforme]
MDPVTPEELFQCNEIRENYDTESEQAIVKDKVKLSLSSQIINEPPVVFRETFSKPYKPNQNAPIERLWVHLKILVWKYIEIQEWKHKRISIVKGSKKKRK